MDLENVRHMVGTSAHPMKLASTMFSAHMDVFMETLSGQE